MEKLPKHILEYFQKLQNLNWPDFQALPDMELYMEQLISYIDRLHYALTENINEKIITSSMINNYVKQEVIPKPEKKKYQKAHVSKIITLSALKRILSIDDVKKFFDLHEFKESQKDYDFFSEALNVKMREKAKMVIRKHEEANKEEDFLKLSMDLLLEAYVNTLYVEKIIVGLEEQKKNKKAKK